ncbi:hypothetical protein PV04_08285 [Phialophora macrospora]|uniref:CBF1-interacting co-repressor CIR N-terminal domain-containing protein n=1 Tax=Phialophora macrospora TaxID=1851006 RepID=A0A0D2FH51_9EURO|nr:hypothetical protein PV04_08285 [Phialophora macrospora]
MPLHLLPKKSWNVYAPANIERVKRDEAEARRKAIEQEKRSLQNEADDRLELLKQHTTRDRKSLKRKLLGEDDTDRDIRLAVESTTTASSGGKQDHGTALDAEGHIPLVPTPPQKKSRLEQEQDKDPYTVYLTDATGRDRNSKPAWYTFLEPERDKWGDDNPRRQQREIARLNANDPLAAMKKGVKALRENEKARKSWMAQRERDLEEVERLARKEGYDKQLKKKRDQEDGTITINMAEITDIGTTPSQITEPGITTTGIDSAKTVKTDGSTGGNVTEAISANDRTLILRSATRRKSPATSQRC